MDVIASFIMSDTLLHRRLFAKPTIREGFVCKSIASTICLLRSFVFYRHMQP